jgi:hypothetical protein
MSWHELITIVPLDHQLELSSLHTDCKACEFYFVLASGLLFGVCCIMSRIVKGMIVKV